MKKSQEKLFVKLKFKKTLENEESAKINLASIKVIYLLSKLAVPSLTISPQNMYKGGDVEIQVRWP